MAAAVVVDTAKSRHARLRPVPVDAVKLTDRFWRPRQERNRTHTLPSQQRQCEATGRIDNFRRASGRKSGVPFHGFFFNDSDVYKWVEACAWQLAIEHDREIEQTCDAVITEIAAAQQPDGYLNTYYMFEREKERWTNLKDMHELYCAGHLIQAAVAHHRVTGQTKLLDVATRFADLICQRFGPKEQGKTEGVCGHQEIEMAMVELSRLTGDEKYLQQASYFIDARGRGLIGGNPYHQDHKPLREMEAVTGHAVRMLYYTSGAADVYAETGDDTIRTSLERLWTQMSQRVTYITGGQGARWEGEAFGSDYELPNARAYTETCAGIANVMWCWRMLQLDGEPKYADMLETALYNGVLSCLSLDGEHYFYQNPLANDGGHRRQPWFECACCPPNIARVLAQLGGYFYSTSDDTVWVHLYAANQSQVKLRDRRAIGIQQETDYPWDGEVRLTIDGDGEFKLKLRIPAWCDGDASMSVNGENAFKAAAGAYATLRRRWKRGDVVRLNLPMPPRRMLSHPYVSDNAGKVALTRGPLVFCLEHVEHAGVDLRSIVLPDDAELSVAWRDELLGGISMITAAGKGLDDAEPRLYLPLRPGTAQRDVTLTAIPYYAWANREAGRMTVWIRRDG